MNNFKPENNPQPGTCPLISIIILNWNGWRDTIECLQSVFQLSYPRFRVIVCDNGSTDGSLERISSWATGTLDLAGPSFPAARGEPAPPRQRQPIPFQVITPDTAPTGELRSPPPLLTLIAIDTNLGYAGGNNVGLRQAKRDEECRFCWILNNDTVVAPDALTALWCKASSSPDIGLCGSTILEYHAPDRIQCLGGCSYFRWLGITRGLERGKPWPFPGRMAETDVEARLAYVSGASLFVSRRFVEEIGMLSPDYFLYYEELDWVFRARGRFRLGYASRSLVYHKEGAQIGTRAYQDRPGTYLADFFMLRNRLLFTRRHCPAALPFVLLSLGFSAVNRLRRRQWGHALLVPLLLLHTLLAAAGVQPDSLPAIFSTFAPDFGKMLTLTSQGRDRYSKLMDRGSDQEVP